MFIADLNVQSANIYEFDINWLCDYKLESILSSLDIHTLQPIDTQSFSYRKFQASQNMLSESSTSLNSNFSACSSLNSSISTSQSTSISPNQNLLNTSVVTLSTHIKGTYTALWFDSYTKKLLAAKCDKQKKTVIEIYNSEAFLYEYVVECSQNEEKPLRRVTSMCCTEEGKVICVDLVQNCVKIFRFV